MSKVVAIWGDLAIQLIVHVLTRIFDTVIAGNFRLAYLVFRLFVLLHPREIRDAVWEAMENAETEKKAVETRESYIARYRSSPARYKYSQEEVEAAAEQEYYRIKLEEGLKMLGEKYARYKTLFKPMNEEVV